MPGAELAGTIGSVDPRRWKLTLVWFVIWLVANIIGDNESLSADPVNWWAGTLILAIAIDLGSRHVIERRGEGS
jgi:hypothetical protein